MKKMIGLMVLALMPAMASAQITTQSLADGKYLTPIEAPCVPYLIDGSTGTNQVAVRAAGGGPGWVSWVAISTTPADATGYIVLRDTGSINNTGINPLGGFLYGASTAQKTVIKFEPPMRFTNGLTATQSLAGMATTICTRLYGTQAP